MKSRDELLVDWTGHQPYLKMPTFLDNQLSAFKSSVVSSSSKISNKRAALSQPTSAPSPAASQSSSKQELKRKRNDEPAIVYSQPADTGTGNELMTRVTYVVDYLKTKNKPHKLEDLLSYLSVPAYDKDTRRGLVAVLRRHPKVAFDPKAFDGKGAYVFKPKHDIRTKDQLLRVLQAQPTAHGLPVKELLEGWPSAEEEIRELEDQNKVLVIRNKKDGHAKAVWPDDPSLTIPMDAEFRDIWHKAKIPDAEAVIKDLTAHDLLPTNKNKVDEKKKVKTESNKKRKKPRKNTRIVNQHMGHILRDYSNKY